MPLFMTLNQTLSKYSNTLSNLNYSGSTIYNKSTVEVDSNVHVHKNICSCIIN